MTTRARGALVAVVAAGAVAAIAITTAASAVPTVLVKGPLYGNIPQVTIRGVAAGKLPWVIKGSAELTATHLTASGAEFVIPRGPGINGVPVPAAVVGTTIGVKSVVAEVSCAGKPGVVTGAAPLSAVGRFSLSTAVKVPTPCMDPIVLVGVGTAGKHLQAWFASTDFLARYGVATPAVIKAAATAKTAAPAKAKPTAKTVTGKVATTVAPKTTKTTVTTTTTPAKTSAWA